MIANELFKQYMGMTHEEREKFLLMFRSIYETHALIEQLKREDEIND